MNHLAISPADRATGAGDRDSQSPFEIGLSATGTIAPEINSYRLERGFPPIELFCGKRRQRTDDERSNNAVFKLIQEINVHV